MKISKTQSSISREFALYSIVTVVVLALVSAWVFAETYRAHSEKIFKKLEYEVTRIDRNLIVEIEHSAYLLESLGRQITHYSPIDKVMIAQFLKSFDTSAIVHNVFSFIDENQFSVVSSNKGVLKKPVDVSDRDFVKKSITDPWKIQIGRPIEGRVSEKWVIPVAMGLTDYTGQFMGTLLISIDINSLTKELAKTLSRTGITFSILSENFVPLTVSGDDNTLIDNDLPLEMLKNLYLERKQKSGILYNPSLYEQNKKYWYYETSSKYPYILVLGYNSALGEESLFAELRPRIGAIFIICVFVVWILWVIRKRIFKPVVDLTEISAAIARGEPYTPLKDPGPMEIEELSAQIKKISEYIHERLRIEDELISKTGNMKRGKDTAELNNRIKAEFITCMGHELKTPLNTIIGFSEVMKNQMFGPMENNRYHQYCSDIYQTGTQMLETINDMLTVSKSDAGLAAIQESPVDVSAVIQKCHRLLSDRISQHQVNLTLNIQDHLPKLMVDELRLKQIVLNLLSNAIKFSPTGGEVIVEARVENDETDQTVFSLIFTDHGKGMSPREVTDLMEGTPEALDSKQQAEMMGGKGFGISLAKTLVSLHQGTLKIHSTLGIGTVVTVSFPKERIVFWN